MLLAPDYYFEKFDDITPDFLLSIGCKHLMSDVDNTLAPYETAEPDLRIRSWLSSLSDAGITVILVSNNDAERIELFNRSLGLYAYPNCKKPLRKRLRAVMDEVGATPESTAFLGDQIYTDVLSARRLGVRTALLVPPIKDKKTLLFRFKRMMEKPIMRSFFKKHTGK